MKEMVAELVNVILQRLEDSKRRPTPQGMRSWLARQGYKKGDIDAAMRVVTTRLAHKNPVHQHGAVRQLSPYESSKMSSEARSALARLDMYEMLTAYEREVLLERVSQMEGEVTLDDLDYLVSWLVCSTRDHESQQSIWRVFEDDRKFLN